MADKGSNKTCDCKELKTIRVFSKEIRNDIIDMYMANAGKTIWQSIFKNVNKTM